MRKLLVKADLELVVELEDDESADNVGTIIHSALTEALEGTCEIYEHLNINVRMAPMESSSEQTES